ncbi:hypothetical protein C2E21_5083 [Chlorella sorokiniana]|uniref:Uncharacterized protein n=1 Tax=Chlorella sorokiniana TaxID=3076 RepID=A0A2P6TQ47_CHLSO|nr:hypothetical protein C2E21_5083 [Chlorella sorokiniana]|eukprot:PRW56149.1 hypothetical protein C2E21_5083 [Chlorella sorokiniana]
MYRVATGAIPYLHPATDYPTRDARITMAAVATYWSLSEGVFNKVSNVIGYNNCETCASGNNYIAPATSCNTLACRAAVCPAKQRQCTWQVGIGAPQVVNAGYSTNIDYVCTSKLAPSLSYARPLSNLPCVQETALKAYGYKLSISQILSNVAKAAGVSASNVLAKTTNCKLSDAECAKRGSTDTYLANCQCQLDRKAWLLRDPAVSITYSAYEWFADRGVGYGTTSALPNIAALKAIYQCLSPP